jgi:Ca2+-transporting ATPase
VPLTAVQLLWINFVTNGPPALALGLDANPGMMRRPPRPARSPLLDRASLVFIVLGGLLVGMIALAILAVLPMVGFSVPEASTAVFVYIACAGLVLAYPARALSDRPRANPWVHLAVALGVVLQLAAVLVAWLRTPLELSPLGPALLGWTGAAVVITWALAELLVRLGTHHPETD